MYKKNNNVLDVYINYESYSRSTDSDMDNGKLVFDLALKGTTNGENIVYTPEILTEIIEIEFGEIQLPDYGPYTFHTQTTNPQLETNTVLPPAFTRTPYGILSIEYYELIHILSGILSKRNSHMLFRAMVEGSKLRLIPLGKRITFKSPQRLSKTATFTITDTRSVFPLQNDRHTNISVYIVSNNGVAPFYLAFGIDRSIIAANERILVTAFNSPYQNVTSYVKNRGGLYISADLRTAFDDPRIVYTNPFINMAGYLPNNVPVNYVSTSEQDNATYNNGVSGVGARLTINSGIQRLDGNALVNDIVLIRHESNQVYNGVYTVISVAPFILERLNGYNTSGNMLPGSLVTHIGPGAGNGTQYYLNPNIDVSIFDIGKSPLTFPVFTMNNTRPVGVTSRFEAVLCTECDVIILNKAFTIPIRYRKMSDKVTNGIIPI